MRGRGCLAGLGGSGSPLPVDDAALSDAVSVRLGMHHGHSTRLAPLYDLKSLLPYLGERSAQLAMRVGFTEVDLTRISERDWDELFRDCRFDAGQFLDRIDEMARRIVPAAEQVTGAEDVASWGSSLPTMFLERLQYRVIKCRRRL